jgi:uncharacterized protein YaaR (DUF327 family)
VVGRKDTLKLIDFVLSLFEQEKSNVKVDKDTNNITFILVNIFKYKVMSG